MNTILVSTLGKDAKCPIDPRTVSVVNQKFTVDKIPSALAYLASVSCILISLFTKQSQRFTALEMNTFETILEKENMLVTPKCFVQVPSKENQIIFYESAFKRESNNCYALQSLSVKRLNLNQSSILSVATELTKIKAIADEKVNLNQKLKYVFSSDRHTERERERERERTNEKDTWQ